MWSGWYSNGQCARFLRNKIKIQGLILCLVLPLQDTWKLWLDQQYIPNNMILEFVSSLITLYWFLPGIRRDLVKSEQAPAQEGNCQRNTGKKKMQRRSGMKLHCLILIKGVTWQVRIFHHMFHMFWVIWKIDTLSHTCYKYLTVHRSWQSFLLVCHEGSWFSAFGKEFVMSRCCMCATHDSLGSGNPCAKFRIRLRWIQRSVEMSLENCLKSKLTYWITSM